MTGTLRINLSAIQSNWVSINRQLGPNAENSAVIKANGYGLGVVPVAQCLVEVGCRTFFVATFAEAKEVSEQLEADVRLFVLTGLRQEEFVPCIEAGFIPVLSSLPQIKHWSQVCTETGAQAFCAIKVDTGMHRLGLSEEDFDELCGNKALLLRCSPTVLMSHLACADKPDHSLNQHQLHQFKRFAEKIRVLVPSISLSLANSSGIALGSDYHFDLVRPGASLYGVNPQPLKKNQMTPAVDLCLPILQIKTVQGPATVGYDATYSVPAGETRRLAIVSGGYADGLFIALSNRGVGRLAGQAVPVVGRISMDSTIFDISSVSEEALSQIESPSISLLDAEYGVDELAIAANTIGYEVLTSLGHRYQRRYIADQC